MGIRGSRTLKLKSKLSNKIRFRNYLGGFLKSKADNNWKATILKEYLLNDSIHFTGSTKFIEGRLMESLGEGVKRAPKVVFNSLSNNMYTCGKGLSFVLHRLLFGSKGSKLPYFRRHSRVPFFYDHVRYHINLFTNVYFPWYEVDLYCNYQVMQLIHIRLRKPQYRFLRLTVRFLKYFISVFKFKYLVKFRYSPFSRINLRLHGRLHNAINCRFYRVIYFRGIAQWFRYNGASNQHSVYGTESFTSEYGCYSISTIFNFKKVSYIK